MRKSHRLLSLLIICCNFQVLQAATYIVSTTGSDLTGDGSVANPFLTPQFAINLAVPYDVIEFREGLYMVGEVRIDISNLTLRSYPGEWAILQSPVNDPDIAATIYYHDENIDGGLIENLEITGGYYYGIFTSSNWDYGIPVDQRRGTSGITIRNCRIHDTGRDCIKITPGSNHISVLNCEIHHSGTGPANSPDPNAEGIDNVNGSDMIVRGCYFHDISTNAVYAKGGAKDALIENNLINGAGEGGILLGFYTDSDYFDEVHNPQYYEAIRGVVRNNIILHTGSEGIGMYGAFHPTVVNNTIIDAATQIHAGIFFNTAEVYIDENTVATPPCVDVSVLNNLVVKHSSNENALLGLRNNAISGNSVVDFNLYHSLQTPVTFSDNIAFPDPDFNTWQSLYPFEASSIISDPQLDSDYHLQSGSVCVDAGTDVNNPFDYDCGPRNNPDIGADEFNAGNVTAFPPPTTVTGTGANTAVLGISHTIVPEVFSISPNPASQFIHLNGIAADQQVVLMDLNGIVIARGTSPLSIPDGLANGIYLIRTDKTDASAAQTVVVIR